MDEKELIDFIWDSANSLETLPKIEQEIMANYKIKDWSKFDYIAVEPPWWSYLVLILVLGLIHGGYFTLAVLNSCDEDGKKDPRSRFRRLRRFNLPRFPRRR